MPSLSYHLERFFRWVFNKPETRAEDAWRVTVDGERVRIANPDGSTSAFELGDVTAVCIATTGDGPWRPDFFVAFLGKERAALGSAPQRAPGGEALFERMRTWPGFDDGAYLLALGSTSEAMFEVWRRAD